VTKIYLLLFSCLLFFSKLDAQTDSTRPPDGPPVPVPDTAVHAIPVRHDSTIRHLSHRDSVRRDSINRQHRMIRDSLARIRQAALADSAARVAAAGTTPTAAPGASTSAGNPSVAPATAGTSATSHPPSSPPAAGDIPADAPPVLGFWQKVLSANPFFNFTGKPVVQAFEIHRSNSKDSLFYLLVGILFYFALIRVFFEKYFNNLMTLFFRVSLRQQQIREQVLQTPLPSLLLNILFIISAGLYACFLLHYSPIGAGIRFWVLYLYCMLLLGVVYLAKFLVLKFIGWVFSISRATDIYVFIVFLVNKMLGIFLLPFLIIITFSSPGIREIFITVSLAMVFVLWSYRVLAAYRPVRNEIKLTPFYFFLYLCAFEIAPLLLIYKVLLTYLEKVY
jgi:hypothetical protein